MLIEKFLETVAWGGAKLSLLSLQKALSSPCSQPIPKTIYCPYCSSSSSISQLRPRSCSWGLGFCVRTTCPPRRGIDRDRSIHPLCSCRGSLQGLLFHSNDQTKIAGQDVKAGLKKNRDRDYFQAMLSWDLSFSLPWVEIQCNFRVSPFLIRLAHLSP